MGADLKIGSVVRLRNRIWRVDQVDDKEFWATPLDGRDTRRWRFLRSLELIALAKKVTAKQDGKLQRLLTILPEVLKRHPRAPRALVFTRYKDTVDYLVKALEKEAKADGPLKVSRCSASSAT